MLIEKSPNGQVMQKIELNPSAFCIPGFLSHSECTQLITQAEHSGFVSAQVRTSHGPQAMPTVRNNQRTILQDTGWVDLLWQRLQQIALPELDGEQAYGLPQELRFYKYTPGQRFKMHKDGPWHENGLSSKLSFLVYLNQDFAGGNTTFRDLAVEAETGMALLFLHATWHEGSAVTTGCKYVLRSDVLYAPASV